MDTGLRVAADYRPAEGNRSGIGRYVYEILQRIHGRPDVRVSLLTSSPFRPIRSPENRGDLNRTKPYGQVPFPFKKLVRLGYTEPEGYRVLKKTRFQILWSTSHVVPGHLVKGPWRHVVTVHDLASRYFPETLGAPVLAQLRRLEEYILTADAVLTVSQTTKHDLVTFLNIAPERVTVVYNGVSGKFCRLDGVPERVRLQYRLPDRFLLFVGTVEPRKNLTRLVKAFDLAARQIPHALVIVGATGWKTAPLSQAVSESPFRDRIVFTGYVDDGDLPAIYNLADALVYPSLYEGFGIPVVEAMACGAPVITSNVSGLAEIADGAAVLVNPLDVCQIAEAIERVVTDSTLKDDLRSKGFERARNFSWDAAAAQVVASFQALCGHPVFPRGTQ